jgi:hypothetical protein
MDGMESKQQVRIGDVVKSLDFVGVSNCYFVGLVTKIDDNDGRFKAKIVKRVWEGNSIECRDEFFFAPLPGNHFFDDLADEKGCEPRIQVVA